METFWSLNAGVEVSFRTCRDQESNENSDNDNSDAGVVYGDTTTRAPTGFRMIKQHQQQQQRKKRKAKATS